jgi:hypothetical protein
MSASLLVGLTLPLHGCHSKHRDERRQRVRIANSPLGTTDPRVAHIGRPFLRLSLIKHLRPAAVGRWFFRMATFTGRCRTQGCINPHRADRQSPQIWERSPKPEGKTAAHHSRSFEQGRPLAYVSVTPRTRAWSRRRAPQPCWSPRRRRASTVGSHGARRRRRASCPQLASSATR